MSDAKSESVFTVDSLHTLFDTQLAGLRDNLRERFEAQTAACDTTRVAQEKTVAAALAAQEKATGVALTAAEKHRDERFAAIWREFSTHLLQVREETAVAFRASEKAIDKAERSIEKRLDGMNEFREALHDQNETMIRRVEAVGLMTSLAERLDASGTRAAERIGKLELAMQTVPSASEKDAAHASLEARANALSDRIGQLELAMQRVPTTTEKQYAQTEALARDTGLTDRVAALERFSTAQLALKQGTTETVNDRRASTNAVLAVVGAIVSVLILVIGFYAAVHR